jgi:hypothetical protein
VRSSRASAVKRTVELPLHLARRLDAIANAHDVGLPTLVTDAVRQLIDAFDAIREKPTAKAIIDVVFYRGPSLLTGEPIVGVLTGLTQPTLNPKTGRVLQTWILRSDRPPMDAVRANLDEAICGDCALRGDSGHDRRCYVSPWLAPNNVWRLVAANRYPEATWPELRARVAGQSLRLGAYGDPAAIPFEVWAALLKGAAGWVGYTHQWHRCDSRFKTILMASVDSLLELRDARAQGWRTFRVVARNRVPLVPGLECRCPASDEAGHRTTCERCQLCRGTSRPARSIAIAAHGNNGVMAAFHRDRASAENTYQRSTTRELTSGMWPEKVQRRKCH